jgi:G3E family GTPase
MTENNRLDAAEAIPVTVLTGFLGSGKTTLLSRLLAHSDMEETAVLINEFGEVGLDHLLVREVSENIVMLNSGCLCCAVRGDLPDSLRELFVMRAKGDIPVFQRAVVETTGLADPAPIIQSLMTDPIIIPRYRLDGIVTTVDAVFGSKQLQEHTESVKQVAIADRLVLTKSDIADEDAVGTVTEHLRRLNPAAPIVIARLGDAKPADLLDCGLFDTQKKITDVERWLNEEAYVAAEHHAHNVDRHDDRISAFCMTLDDPIEWKAFAIWVEMLLSTHGEGLLRVKGVLNVVGQERPVAIHGVQHVFYPPATLAQWVGEDRRSRLVFITRDLDRQAITETFRAVYEHHVAAAESL